MSKKPLSFTKDTQMHMIAHLAASKAHATRLAVHLHNENADKLLITRAGMIIALIRDAQLELSVIAEELKWND